MKTVNLRFYAGTWIIEHRSGDAPVVKFKSVDAVVLYCNERELSVINKDILTPAFAAKLKF